MIRLFVIVKNTIYISALEPFLRSNGVDIVTTCSNSGLAIDYYKKVESDLVLMDVNWNDTSHSVKGESLIAQLKQQNPSVKIIGITSFFDTHMLTRLKELEVQGYFFRNMDNLLEEIKLCIDQVKVGKTYYATIGAQRTQRITANTAS